jgi:hypothetical protein
MNRELLLADPDRVASRQFWPQVLVEGEGECWTWTGSTLPKGYGRITLGGTKGAVVYAHRWSYAYFVGPFSEELAIDHLCKNRSCVNPAHLEPVTRVVNTMRGECPAARGARATYCVNGHPFTPENTHTDHKGHRICRACNKEGLRALRAKCLVAPRPPRLSKVHCRWGHAYTPENTYFTKRGLPEVPRLFERTEEEAPSKPQHKQDHCLKR